MTVTVYRKPGCVQCDATERYLGERGIEFDTKDLTEPANLDAAKALGHLAAPVVVFTPPGASEEVSWSGFRPDKLDAIVEAAA
ncbi:MULTISPECIES: glutaredoxin domain-containing protein [unclassified Microbacterium]|uniref:glutaredoxin domain-containing protein n=1 Tax=unclassified Microbacterium TaxID=2609290 RepID=UPI003441B7F5